MDVDLNVFHSNEVNMAVCAVQIFCILPNSWHSRLQRERAQAAEREKVGQGCQVVGQGCQGPAVGGAVVGGVAIQQPLPPLLHQLPPARAGPSSEHSHRDTDPLLSSTAHAPDQ